MTQHAAATPARGCRDWQWCQRVVVGVTPRCWQPSRMPPAPVALTARGVRPSISVHTCVPRSVRRRPALAHARSETGDCYRRSAAEAPAVALAGAHARGLLPSADSSAGGGGALAASPHWLPAPGPGHSAHAAVTVSRGLKRVLFRPADPAVVARRRLNPKALDASPEPERAPRWEPARMALHDSALGNVRGQMYIAR